MRASSGGEGSVRGAESDSAHAPRRILFPSPSDRGMRNLGSGGDVLVRRVRTRSKEAPSHDLTLFISLFLILRLTCTHTALPFLDTWVSSVDFHL